MLLENTICKEDKLEEICQKLNKLIRDILHMEAKFSYYGLAHDGYYTIHNKNKSQEDKKIDLNMRLYFDEKDNFIYAYILWFSVSPKRVGLGSKIINELIKVLESYTHIEFIIIHPKDKEVKKFWMKNNFKDDLRLWDKGIEINTRRILSFYIKKEYA